MSMPSIRSPGQMSGAGTPEARPERALVGTWRLLAWEARGADGTVAHPFGERAVGYGVYTADGHVFVQLMRPSRPPFVGGDVFGGTAEENALAIGGYGAYGGTYELEDGGGTVVHHLEMSLFPNWIGGVQRRTIEWDADRLILSTPPILGGGSTLVHRLTWERVLPGGGA
jgi:hypothetical protein